MSVTKFLNKVINFLKARYAPRGARQSFSGAGEDLIMNDILLKHGVKKPSYIDIGSHHPVFGNNTYFFYRNGGRGVLVEPNESLCKISKSKRSADIVVNAGVGRSDSEADYYAFKRNTRNTFSGDEALAWEKTSGEKAKTSKRSIVSLDSLIKDCCGVRTPDLISIDTEGFELEILNGFSWKLRPKIFCVETASSSEGRRSSEMNTIMTEHGYELCSETPVNAIYVDKNLKKT
ncbi:MAG: FkbM family methyltransferase [Minisyncoccota bacterium]